MAQRALPPIDVLRGLPVLAWTGAFTWLLVGHRIQALLGAEPSAMAPYVTYLQAGLWPILALGLALSGVFAVCLLVRESRPATSAVRWVTTLAQVVLVTLPLAFLSMAPEAGLDSYAFRTRFVPGGGLGQLQGVRGGGPAEDGTVSLLNLLMEADRHDGEEVTVVGRVNSDDQWPPGHFMLYRFMVFCCAADARPVGVLVKLPGSAAIAPDSWVRVTGTLEITDADSLEGAILDARQVLRTEQPANPYLLPY